MDGVVGRAPAAAPKKDKKLWVQQFVEPKTKLPALVSQKRRTSCHRVMPVCVRAVGLICRWRALGAAAEHESADAAKIDKIAKRIKAVRPASSCEPRTPTGSRLRWLVADNVHDTCVCGAVAIHGMTG